MYLSKLSVLNYKNIVNLDLQFIPRINCFTGMNGAGKSNLLDAIYSLSMTKSYFSHLEWRSVNYNAPKASLEGQYIRPDGGSETISLQIDREGGKLMRRNSKPYKRFGEHIGLIPIVMISPYDSVLVNGSGEERRRFLNSILSQLDVEYLRNMQNYNRLLAQRNRLLKSDLNNSELLDILSQQMTSCATPIFQKRGHFITHLTPVVQQYYEKVSGGKEKISIEYQSDLYSGDLYTLHKKSTAQDRAVRHTTTGIHRDELLFSMNGVQIKFGGSQGQQKSFLLSLKFAQFEIMRELFGKSPILLLDDLFDKLDLKRVEALLEIVSSQLFSQVFITDSNKVRVSELLKLNGHDAALFKIENGAAILE
ncbi:MAG: DNA replication and repair protein RecF [Bacteroidales bacterium]